MPSKSTTSEGWMTVNSFGILELLLKSYKGTWVERHSLMSLRHFTINWWSNASAKTPSYLRTWLLEHNKSWLKTWMIKVKHALLGLITLFGSEIAIKAVLWKCDDLSSIFCVLVDNKRADFFTNCGLKGKFGQYVLDLPQAQYKGHPPFHWRYLRPPQSLTAFYGNDLPPQWERIHFLPIPVVQTYPSCS